VPAVDDTATALGVLYVVEGSTLGGAVLRRRLAGGRIPDDAFGFLTSYGDDVGRRWRGYRAATARWVEEHPEQGDRVVAAAGRTFEVLTRWTATAGSGP
jgi:heme oxygenase